jgi:hypothetical protein
VTSEDQRADNGPPDTSLANRYGRQKRAWTAKTKRVMVVSALLVAIAFMAWISTSLSTETVTFKDVGYSTPDATQAVIDFQVTKERDAEVKCAVKALDSKFAIVGWKVVDVGPNGPDVGSDGGRTTAHRVVLRTESQAVSGVVDSCWIPEDRK